MSSNTSIELHTGDCHGCYGCVELYPEIFGWDDTTERPFLKATEADEDAVIDAASCCPRDCIMGLEEE